MLQHLCSEIVLKKWYPLDCLELLDLTREFSNTVKLILALSVVCNPSQRYSKKLFTVTVLVVHYVKRVRQLLSVHVAKLIL